MGRQLEGHACCVWAATAGVQGPHMGSDEQPLVLLSYILIELHSNKVTTRYITPLIRNLL